MYTSLQGWGLIFNGQKAGLNRRELLTSQHQYRASIVLRGELNITPWHQYPIFFKLKVLLHEDVNFIPSNWFELWFPMCWKLIALLKIGIIKAERIKLKCVLSLTGMCVTPKILHFTIFRINWPFWHCMDTDTGTRKIVPDPETISVSSKLT